MFYFLSKTTLCVKAIIKFNQGPSQSKVKEAIDFHQLMVQKKKVKDLELRILKVCPVNALHSNAITALE